MLEEYLEENRIHLEVGEEEPQQQQQQQQQLWRQQWQGQRLERMSIPALLSFFGKEGEEEEGRGKGGEKVDLNLEKVERYVCRWCAEARVGWERGCGRQPREGGP